ncbi:MAG: hypothetical protein WBH00_13110 [Xanthobacteraceae bacterium]
MLQLPGKTSGRFSKAQIAEMSRGEKNTVRPLKAKRDPIIAVIQRADRAMNAWIKARNDLSIASQLLDERDRGFVDVRPIDEPEIFREFGRGFIFRAEGQVATLFKQRRQLARQRIKHTREAMKVPADRRTTTDQEHQQHLAHEKRLIAALLKFEPAQRKAVRVETRRLHRVQKAAGLLAARSKRRAALASLSNLTEVVAGMKPINREGALAVIDYVGKRLFPDRADFFMDGIGVDGNFWELLRLAHDVLERAQ